MGARVVYFVIMSKATLDTHEILEHCHNPDIVLWKSVLKKGCLYLFVSAQLGYKELFVVWKKGEEYYFRW